jgi:iron complex transport system permease protein
MNRAAARRVSYFAEANLGLLLLFTFMVSIVTSPSGLDASIGPQSVLDCILSHLHLPHAASNQLTAVQDAIIWGIRLPRAIVGAGTGILLALAGVAFQSFLMNPMADPYMVGVSAGSALGSAVIILVGGTGWLAGMAQPFAAFASGMAAMVVVTVLARVNGRLSVQTFLLAGFVLGTFVYSITRLAIALANRQNETSKTAQILAQLLGSLQGASWQSVWLLLPLGVIASVVLMASRKELNLMSLGEESAAHLGVDTEQFKRRIIVAGSLAAASTVAVAGIIGFVGMVVPHIARRIVGPDHTRLLPCAAMLGGIVLCAADTVGRVWFNGLEVGVITAIAGAPVFCYLLRRRLVSGW